MHRVMITLPDDLLQATDEAARELGQNRSEFIRTALIERLAALRRQEFEALLAEGYQEMAGQSASLGDDAAAAQSLAAAGVWVWDEE